METFSPTLQEEKKGLDFFCSFQVDREGINLSGPRLYSQMSRLTELAYWLRSEENGACIQIVIFLEAEITGMDNCTLTRQWEDLCSGQGAG